MVVAVSPVLLGLIHATVRAAEEAAPGAAAEAGISFNLFWILVSAANFGFFILVLRAVALGPIMKMLDERRERIERGLREAAEATIAKGRAEEAAGVALADARRESNE
ncbi:MAG: ATP synthase F0 subunit B, partial [Candidatus Limnocylindrus sp.]